MSDARAMMRRNRLSVIQVCERSSRVVDISPIPTPYSETEQDEGLLCRTLLSRCRFQFPRLEARALPAATPRRAWSRGRGPRRDRRARAPGGIGRHHPRGPGRAGAPQMHHPPRRAAPTALGRGGGGAGAKRFRCRRGARRAGSRCRIVDRMEPVCNLSKKPLGTADVTSTSGVFAASATPRDATRVSRGSGARARFALPFVRARAATLREGTRRRASRCHPPAPATRA